MSYNGSGTFQINTSGQPVVAGTVISSTAFNALTADLATGLSTAITKDGQTTTTARIPFAQGISSTLTTDSSSTTTGSIITAGGVGIVKNLYVGANTNIAGTLGVTGVATFSAAPIYSSLTASSAVATDASKALVSVTNTGTGNNVLAGSPTLTGTVAGASLSLSSLTSGRVTYATTSGLLTDSANLTFNGTTLTTANDASISGLTVGKGGSAVASNTAVGSGALAANTSGAGNAALGSNALNANTTGGGNSAFNQSSLLSNTTGGSNTAYGNASLPFNTTGSSNTAVGQNSLYSNTTASNNTAVGYQAAYTSTTATGIVAVGWRTLYSNTGNNNTAVGANVAGVFNSTLYANTTGTENAAFGTSAMVSNTTGSNNVAVGSRALVANTTASNNTAIGYLAGNTITTGTNNVCVGQSSAGVLTTGSSNIFIGSGSHVASSASVSNEILIATGNQTGKGASTGFIQPNGGGVFQGNNAATWSVTSDQRLKKNIVNNNIGLDIINQIQVRNFEYRLPEEITEVSQDQAIDKTGIQLGVIAQELQQILPECVKTESTGVMTVDADNLTWYLINAIKELKAEIDALKGA